MSVINSVLTVTRTNQSQPTSLRHLPGYLMCVILGLLSGAISTVVVIGLAIIVQLLLVPGEVFAPHLILFTVAALVTGLVISWLAGFAGRFGLPALFNQANGYEMRIVTSAGALTSLIQTILFIYIL